MTSFPQGRNITQYQFIDDFSWVKGNHAFKFGGNFRRYDVSDHNFFFNYPGVYFGYSDPVPGMQQFVDGLAYQYRQNSNLASNVPIAMWGLGVYAMDEWKINPNFTLTAALRIERNSNPVCQIDCFANFVSPWTSLPSYNSESPGDVPYNKDIVTGLHQAYNGVDAINWSPRLGFSWSLNGGKTVLSGGFGLFYDNPAAGMVDNLLANPPISTSFRVRQYQDANGDLQPGTLWADPGPQGGAALFQASADAFNAGFPNGASYNSIRKELSALGVTFTAPAFNNIVGTIHSPRWQQWNFKVQQQLDTNTVLEFNYVGNHGIRIPYANSLLNAYDPGWYDPANNIFPSSAPVRNYGTVTQYMSGAVSNYNGLTISLRRSFARGFSAHANYTWSHNIDEISNGGLFTYGDSLLGQICPQSLRSCNYGNSDYDIRHLFNADFIYRPTFHIGNGFLDRVANGWEWSGKMFLRSGLPFSVNYGASTLSNSTAAIMGYPIAPTAANDCGVKAASANGVGIPCLASSAFLDANTNYFPGMSPQRRNMFTGPGFFDFDMGLTKYIKLTERVQFAIGAQAYNVFNHPNFSNPISDLGDTTGFGQINTMQNMPTSPYGSFLGFDSSVRVLQISGKITF